MPLKFRYIILGGFLTGAFAFLLFLIPGIDMVANITGSLIVDLDTALGMMLGPFGYLGATVAELLLFNAYPFSWILTHRPEDALTVLVMITPWLLSGLITCKVGADNPKDALKIGIVLIISNIAWNIVGLILLMVVANIVPYIDLIAILNGLTTGLTDMPVMVSSVLVNLEGGGMFILMGVFVGVINEGREK
ncbi:MAG: hypothetical protein ACFFCS_18015 [Candidatus Hodarchaeota archaeon]